MSITINHQANSLIVPSAANLLLGTNNSTKLTLDSDGNLGLGVSTSLWDVSVYRSFDIGTSGIAAGTATSELLLVTNAYKDYTSTYYYKNTGAAARYEINGQEHRWANAPSGTSGTAATFTQVMTLDSSGSLGIGTTSPSGWRLNVSTGVAGNIAQFSDGVSSTLIITTASGSTVSIGQANNGPLAFLTNSTERARITSGGNFLIGATAAGGSKLRIADGADDSTAYGSAQVTRATGGGGIWHYAAIAAGAEIVGFGFDVNNLATFGNGSNPNSASSYIKTGTVSSESTVIFGTAGVEKMRLTLVGHLGVGVTPSTWSLGKSVEVGFGGNALWGNAIDSLYITQNMYYDGNFRYKNTAGATNYQQTIGSHRWFVAGSGTAGNVIAFTQAMTLDSSGNLGLGTTSPTSRLSVTGSADFSGAVGIGAGLTVGSNAGTGDANIELGSGRSGNGVAYVDFHAATGQDYNFRILREGGLNGNVAISNTGTGYIVTNLNGTERSRLTDWGLLITGNLVVGNGLSGEKQITFSNNNRYLYYYLASDGQNLGVWDSTGGYHRFYSDVSGNFWIRGTLTQNSDERLKTNWRDLGAGFVNRLAGVKSGIYDRVDMTDESYVGVAAQSLQLIMPNAVRQDKETGMLSVDYGSAALVSSVELAKKIVEQEDRIARLEALIERMQNV